MTREEILARKPGRILDALVAEKILGWKITWPVTDEYDWVVGVHGRMNYGINPVTGKEDHLPFPSTDIREAWDVFMEILDPNITSLNPWGNGQVGLWWSVCSEEDVIANGRTAQEAICKAALLMTLDL